MDNFTENQNTLAQLKCDLEKSINSLFKYLEEIDKRVARLEKGIESKEPTTSAEQFYQTISIELPEPQDPHAIEFDSDMTKVEETKSGAESAMAIEAEVKNDEIAETEVENYEEMEAEVENEEMPEAEEQSDEIAETEVENYEDTEADEQNEKVTEAEEQSDEIAKTEEENYEEMEAEVENEEMPEAEELSDEIAEAEVENYEEMKAEVENEEITEAEGESEKITKAEEQSDEIAETEVENYEDIEAEVENGEVPEAEVESEEITEAEELSDKIAETEVESKEEDRGNSTIETPSPKIINDISKPDWFDWEVDYPASYIDDVYKGISFNDRYEFIKELFNINDDLYQAENLYKETLDTINQIDNFKSVVAYIREHFPNWDEESDEVYRFYMAIRRKFNK